MLSSYEYKRVFPYKILTFDGGSNWISSLHFYHQHFKKNNEYIHAAYYRVNTVASSNFKTDFPTLEFFYSCNCRSCFTSSDNKFKCSRCSERTKKLISERSRFVEHVLHFWTSDLPPSSLNWIRDIWTGTISSAHKFPKIYQFP